MKCSQCGAALSADDKFCTECGQPAAPAAPTCPQCGVQVSPGAAFCKACGARLQGATATPPTAGNATVRQPPPAAAQAQSTYRQQPAPSAPGQPGAAPFLECKGVFPRLFAIVIDMLLLVAVSVVFECTYFIIVTGMDPGHFIDRMFFGQGAAQSWAMLLESTGNNTIFNTILNFLYFIPLEASGGTLGKRLLGMRVVNAEGRKPGLGKSAGRNLLRFIDFLPAFYILGGIMVLSTKQKQRLGDKAARTFVVSARSSRT